MTSRSYPNPSSVTLSTSQLSDITRSLHLMQAQFAQLNDTVTLLSSVFSRLSSSSSPPLTTALHFTEEEPEQEESVLPPRPAHDDDDDEESTVDGEERRQENSRILRALEDEEKRTERPTPLLTDRSTAVYTTNSKPTQVWRKAGQPSPSTLTSSALSPTTVSAQSTGQAGKDGFGSFSPVSPPLTSSIVALPPLNSAPLPRALFPIASSQAHTRSPQLSAARRKSTSSEGDEDEIKLLPNLSNSNPALPKRSTTPLPSTHLPSSTQPLDPRSSRSSSDTFKPLTSLEDPPHSPHPHPFPSSTPTSPTSKHIFLSSPNKIKLNVGGTLFHTTLSTLCSPSSASSYLHSMFSGHFPLELDSKGAYFLDRDPTLFRHILNFCRDGSLPLSSLSPHTKHALLRESRYFGLSQLTGQLQGEVREMRARQRRELSQEKEYRLVQGVEEKEMGGVFQKMTMMEGYDFEDWIGGGGGGEGKGRGGSLGSLGGREGVAGVGKGVHILFSKKLSRGELMLLDRLQTGM